jgi:lysozyme
VANPPRKTLAGVVGVLAAGLILTMVPREESGREVAVTVTPDHPAQIKHISGPRYLKVYLDIAGIPTACDGLTGPNIRPGMTFTEQQCSEMLEAELVETAEKVQSCTPILRQPGMDYQRAAVIVFAHNIGKYGYCGSTAAKKFNAGDIPAACDWFLPWNKARVNGTLRAVDGLTKRRARERQVCLTNAYTPANLGERLREVS